MTENLENRVRLRPVEDADLPILFGQQLDAEAIRMAAFTAKDPTDRTAFDAHWAKIRASDIVTIRAVLFDGRVAGSVLCHSWYGDTEVSYWFGREFWGQGIATQALAAFVAEKTFRPLFGRAAKDNVRSIRVMEKCGFELVKEERGFANARGEEIDEVVMRLG